MFRSIIALDYSKINTASSFFSKLKMLHKRCLLEKQDAIFIKCTIPEFTKPNTIKVAIGDSNNYENIPVRKFENLISSMRKNNYFELFEGITYKIPLTLLEHILQKESGLDELNDFLCSTMVALSKLKSQLSYDDYVFVYCGKEIGFGLKTETGLADNTIIASFYSGEINLSRQRTTVPDPELYGYAFDLKEFIDIDSIYDEYFSEPDLVYELDAYHFGGLLSFINHEINPNCHQAKNLAYSTDIGCNANQMLSVSYGELYQYRVISAGAKFISNIKLHIQQKDFLPPKNFTELYNTYCGQQQANSTIASLSLFKSNIYEPISKNINTPIFKVFF